MNLTQPIPKNFDEMVATMLRCQQTQGQSVYQHGQSVCTYFFDIVDHIKGLHKLDGHWKIPDWVSDYGESLVENLHDENTIRQYTLYHDCGKPYCRVVDGAGAVHFPDHVEVSKHIWECVGGDKVVGNLIGEDMAIHTGTADEISHKIQKEWSVKDASTLLIAALAEIHSNARMFGGVDSVSFKIKWKNLDRRGKQICKLCFGEKPCIIRKAS